jgi:hypothetical protein
MAPPSASAALPVIRGPAPISVARAGTLLFLDEAPPEAAACAKESSVEAGVSCLIRLRYGEHPRALKLALGWYASTGSVAGVEEAHVMDGGWRGKLSLVPELPVRHHRRHLAWIVSAYADFNHFFEALGEPAQRRYHHQPIALRFFRSVGRTTPSAYAHPWVIAYNVSGSLHRGPDAVRETLFHEIFHLNDSTRGDWSRKHLTPHYDAIVARCTGQGRLSTPCLRPYAPGDTVVRGGTYYAFQPGNGVGEYAAEIATRYYQEHRRLLAGKALSRSPFKCGPKPNGQVWSMFVDEFFGGVDRVAACP